MSSDLQHEEAAGLLPAYAAGTLANTQYAALIWHLRSCSRCSQEVEEWLLLGRAAQTALPPVLPDHRLLTAVLRQLPAPSPLSPRRLLTLVWAQAPLVRQQIWTASALVLSLGLVTLLLGRGGGAVLTVLAPVVAAVGVAFLYGPEQDPSLELALSTPTSPRLILLARLTLVFGYDLALGLLVSLLLALADQAPLGIWQLVAQWLGPMLLLSALSLWLSQALGSLAATFVPLTIWAVRVGLVGTADLSGALLQAATLLGTTNVPSLVISLAIVGGVLLALPGQERVGCA